jgi:tetratricopeptide (TPR) repeat protein
MAMRVLGWLLCCGVLLLLLLSSAHAQETGAAGSAPNPSRDEHAHKFFEAGRAAYDVGSYREALSYFQQAYELSGRSQLLYNIGQCADRLRMDDVALDAFKRYLQEVPSADNRLQVQERIRLLEEIVKSKQDEAQKASAAAQAASLAPSNVAASAPATAEPKVVATSPVEQPTPWYGRWYTWGGVGGVVAAGVLVAVVASSSSSGPATHHTPSSGVSIQALQVTQ